MEQRPGPQQRRKERKQKIREEKGQQLKEWEVQCNKMVDDFIADEAKEELRFPPSLGADERKIVHHIAVVRGLASFSDGEGSFRYVLLRKTLPTLPYTVESLASDLRNVWVKEFRLPITVFQSPHFEYFVDLYDEWFDTKAKLNNFLVVLNQEGEQKKTYGQYKAALEERVCATVKATEAYARFESDSLADYCVEPIEGVQQEYAAYSKENIGNYFVSLDLSSANFNSLRYYDSQLVFGCKTWTEFLSRFTEYQHFYDCKPFRQKTLNFLNGDGQTKITTYLIHKITSSLLQASVITTEQIKGIKTDEVVLAVTEEEVLSTALKIKEFLQTNLQDIDFVKVEPFQLVKVGPASCKLAGYVKEIIPLSGEGKRKAIIKSVHPEHFALVYRKYRGEPTTPYDCVWYQTNRGLQTINETLFWEQSKKH